MARHHLRKDKTCLNCGFTVEERFCSRCGQENQEPKESFGHLIGHFFADVTHFDSQIFSTLKRLLFRPGFLTREYIAGKRASYLNPVRMYVFISAVFFLAVFAGSDDGHSAGEEASQVSGKADTAKVAGDTMKTPPGEEAFIFSFGSGGKVIFNLTENKYHSLREYDSVQRALPDSARDKGAFGWMLRNNVRLKEQHNYRTHIRLESDVAHTIPKIMFLLLPLFALFVGWFYSRKRYFYVQHAIFSIHYHSFVFLLFLLTLLVEKLIPGEMLLLVLVVVPGISLLLAFTYLVAALKGMYGQSLGMAFVKALGISLLYLIFILLALGLLIVTTFLWY
ncbi:MAG TPA: DUF3667 domain-containing protein [Puia sp.]|nr:DUF3667 domain-containing protein [Puia sp.]